MIDTHKIFDKYATILNEVEPAMMTYSTFLLAVKDIIEQLKYDMAENMLKNSDGTVTEAIHQMLITKI